jgi:glycosyltransferase involved in cell wall biosynthesis
MEPAEASRRPKRILQIIPTLDQGGAEKQLCLLAAGLPRDEFDVHVCALTRQGPRLHDLQQAGVPVTLIGKRWKVDPLAYWRLKKLIRRLRPDIVHTWIFAANSYGRQAAWACGVPAIIAGERCVDRWKSWKELAIDRYLARRSTRIAVNSSGVVDFYANLGLPREKFVVIPNAIAPRPVEPYARQAFLAELELPETARLIGAVGRLWPQKRYKDLMWASDLLATARDDTYLLIAGDGPQLDELQRFRRKLGFGERIRFLGHRDDVPRWLSLLDVFWLGSGYEGQSNGLMEAMVAEVPAVVSDIAGNRDLVRPEIDGLFFQVGNRADLARQTVRLLEDPAWAKTLGHSAGERMRRDFSLAQMIEAYAAMYREVG